MEAPPPDNLGTAAARPRARRVLVTVAVAAALAAAGFGMVRKLQVDNLTQVVGETPLVMMCFGCSCRPKHYYTAIHDAPTCEAAGGRWQNVGYSGPHDGMDHRFFCLTPTQDPCDERSFGTTNDDER